MTKIKDKNSLFYTIPRMRPVFHRGEGLFYRKWRLISLLKAHNLIHPYKYYRVSYLRYKVRIHQANMLYADSDSCKSR